MRIETWKNTVLKNYLYKETANQAEIDHIIDFFKRNPDVNTTRLSYIDAKTKAEQWTINLNKKSQNLKNSGLVEELMTFEDGSRFVLLKDKTAYAWEGSKMGHCVASYFSSRSIIYSLRDSDEMPHCTIEASPKQIVQIKGKANAEIAEKYSDKVLKFLQYINLGINIHHDGVRFLASKGYMNAEAVVVTFCEKFKIDLEVLVFKNNKYYKLPKELNFNVEDLKLANRKYINHALTKLITNFRLTKEVMGLKKLVDLTLDVFNDNTVVQNVFIDIINLDSDELTLKCYPKVNEENKQNAINYSIRKDKFNLFTKFHDLDKELILTEKTKSLICEYGSSDFLAFLVEKSNSEDITNYLSKTLGNTKKTRIILKNNPQIDYHNLNLAQRIFQLGVWNCFNSISPELKAMFSFPEMTPFFKKSFNEKLFTMYIEMQIDFPCHIDEVLSLALEKNKTLIPVLLDKGAKFQANQNYDEHLVRMMRTSHNLNEEQIFNISKQMLELGANPHYSDYAALTHASSNKLGTLRDLLLTAIAKTQAPKLVHEPKTKEQDSLVGYELELIKIFSRKVFGE